MKSYDGNSNINKNAPEREKLPNHNEQRSDKERNRAIKT